MFRTGPRLVSPCLNLLQFLDKVDKLPALYLNKTVKQNAIRRYEHCWIPLLASVPPDKRTALVAPLDVEWVWVCHMLCPVQYAIDSAATWAAIKPEETDFLLDHQFQTGRKYAKGSKLAAELWRNKFPAEPYDITGSIENAPLRDKPEDTLSKPDAGPPAGSPMPPSRIQYDIDLAAERQMAFHYQTAIMPQYRSPSFLRGAVKRYEDMFLVLMQLYPSEVWVPTYDIDLVWHAHMTMPARYKQDTFRRCRRLVPHDDTLNDRTDGSELLARWEATKKRWNEQFNMPVSRPGGMFRGNVSAEERMLRPAIVAQIEAVTRTYQSCAPTGLTISFNGSDEVCRDTSPVAGVEWVHAIQWNEAIRSIPDATRGDESLETRIERLSFLSPQGNVPLLMCRVSHAMGFRTFQGTVTPHDCQTILEVYKLDEARLPLASAHFLMPGGIPLYTDEIPRIPKDCRISLLYDRAMLLRVAGEDFGILAGRWVAFACPRKGTETSRGTRGGRGMLVLRFWPLQGSLAKKWHRLDGTQMIKGLSRYSLSLRKPGNRWERSRHDVSFDLHAGKISISRAEDLVPAYLMCMVSSVLQVWLQPRFEPKGGITETPNSGETMYPAWTVEQSKYPTLVAGGGETFRDKKRSGLGQLLFEIHSRGQQSPRTASPVIGAWGYGAMFAGSVDEIGSPGGDCAAGCGGCGGGCGACGGGGCGGGGCGGGGCGGCGG